MTDEKMEQRLAAALEKTAPDDVNGVLSRCEERKGTVIPMTRITRQIEKMLVRRLDAQGLLPEERK